MSDDRSKKPDDREEGEPDVEEVVTGYRDIRLRSSFRVVDEGEGHVSFEIQPPLFEVLDDESDDESEDGREQQ